MEAVFQFLERAISATSAASLSNSSLRVLSLTTSEPFTSGTFRIPRKMCSSPILPPLKAEASCVARSSTYSIVRLIFTVFPPV